MRKNSLLFAGWIGLTAFMCLAWFLRSHPILQIGFSVVGSLIGFVLPVFLDILLPKFMTGHIDLNSSMAKDVLSQGVTQVREGHIQSDQAPKTPLRSYPLLLSYMAIALLIMSSSHDLFPRGFIVGLGFSLVADLVMSRRPIEHLKDRWFSVFHANLSDKEFDYFIAIMTGAYILITIVAVFV